MVRTLERGEVVPGVQLELWHNGQKVGNGVSDGAGVARIGPLSRAGYDVRVASPLHWPTTALLGSIEHDAEAVAPSILEVRRKGGLKLHLTYGGLPLADCAVDLEYLEATAIGEDPSVGAWVAAARVPTAPTGLRTDTAGDLVLGGIPAGPYRWSSIVGDSEYEGIVQVAPLEQTSVNGVLE